MSNNSRPRSAFTYLDFGFLVVLGVFVGYFLYTEVRRGEIEKLRVPPKLTVEQIVSRQDVLLIKGRKIHWLDSKDLKKEYAQQDEQRGGPVLLEAEVIKVLQCVTSCPADKTVILFLPYYAGHPASYAEKLDHYLIVAAIPEGLKSQFPDSMSKEWFLRVLDSQWILPVSKRAEVEEAIRQRKTAPK
jgi:hypothetical protein